MWIFQFISDSVLHLFIRTILVTGILCTLIGFLMRVIPYINQYRLIVQLIGLILLPLGIYFEGGYGVEMAWREKAKQLEEAIAISEKKAGQVNERIKYITVEKIKTVKDVQVVIQDRIREVATKIDQECKVDPEAIKILNDSAKNIKKPTPRPLTLKLSMELHNG